MRKGVWGIEKKIIYIRKWGRHGECTPLLCNDRTSCSHLNETRDLNVVVGLTIVICKPPPYKQKYFFFFQFSFEQISFYFIIIIIIMITMTISLNTIYAHQHCRCCYIVLQNLLSKFTIVTKQYYLS